MNNIIIRPKFGVPEALTNLRPNAKWTVNNNDYSTIKWLDYSITKPSKEEVDQEIIRLETEYNNTQYYRDRAKEYPPITDYIDGVVKGDQDQINAYIAACQAVKAKYPKPE